MNPKTWTAWACIVPGPSEIVYLSKKQQICMTEAVKPGWKYLFPYFWNELTVQPCTNIQLYSYGCVHVEF